MQSRQVAARAGSNEGPGTEASGMTRNEALEVLGLSESASFDRIMLTKNKLTQNTKDLGVVAQVEAAYDVLLMENMKQRLTGEVARSVRFADVKRPAPPKQSAGPRKLPGGLTLVTPQQDVLLKQSGVFAALAAWTLVGALTAPPSPMGADAGAPGIQLALAVGASVYFMRESQKLSLGRSAAITAGGFVAGTVVGAVLNNFLRVDIVPIGAFSSPGALVGEFSILGMWAASAFLR
eukprot:CAMPEP_0206135552 /NCGR_PEP_ID=MMETSP1473-20131121/821_1 /ASSEMBLY_ACC=CAM_ASM_001109 /TAXON_ID=1461547 /ORGANISM="Stichococcus sp, Strain RCC1054" /LENGTH=235 /DNA_ID=CAMNT_0053527473 /DNA_START=246 /DNA_END=954 /DNA_ORIENTATION=-